VPPPGSIVPLAPTGPGGRILDPTVLGYVVLLAAGAVAAIGALITGLAVTAPDIREPIRLYLWWGASWLVAGLLTGAWTRLTYRNAARIAPQPVRHHIVWTWAGWILPIACWWYPLLVVRDCWRVTGQGGRPPRTGMWWALFTAYGVLSIAVNLTLRTTVQLDVFGRPQFDPEAATRFQLASSFWAVIGLLAFAYWVDVVRTVSAAQRRLARAR
jgi:hypothetical protein